MTDDIVTRLRGKEHGGKDLRCEACDGFCCHCELCDCCIEIMEVSLESADEIERLRKLAHNLYEETKRCGSLHDTPATMDYEEWLEEND